MWSIETANLLVGLMGAVVGFYFGGEFSDVNGVHSTISAQASKIETLERRLRDKIP